MAAFESNIGMSETPFEEGYVSLLPQPTAKATFKTGIPTTLIYDLANIAGSTIGLNGLIQRLSNSGYTGVCLSLDLATENLKALPGHFSKLVQVETEEDLEVCLIRRICG